MRVGISIPYTLLKRTGGAALAKKTFTKIERVREKERERRRRRKEGCHERNGHVKQNTDIQIEMRTHK